MNIMEDMKMRMMSDLNITKFSDKEQKKFALFKQFLESPLNSKNLMKLYSNEKNLTKLCYFTQMLKEIKKENFYEKFDIENQVKESYKKILQQGKKLALELKIDNSLEAANLFTYLLWNGFFSKDKSLSFSISDTDGLFYKSIMGGTGVCSNFSDMLTDFINEFDFSCATIINYMNNRCKPSVKINLKRNLIKDSFSTKIINFFLYPYEKIMGNHAFNLIKDNNGIYIYDSTNLSALKVENKQKAKYLSGKGAIKLQPYHSYVVNFSKKSIDTLDSLHKNTSFETPYKNDDFVSSWDKCFELFLTNMYLINDFYEEIKSDIINIDKANKRQFLK